MERRDLASCLIPGPEIKKKEFLYGRVLLVRLYSQIIDDVGFPRGYRPPYALKYIEALLKKAGRDVKFIDCVLERLNQGGLLAGSMEYLPDLIVLFGTSIEFNCLMEYAAMVKRCSGAVIVAIGQDITARPQAYLFESSPVDIILPGEPEIELVELLRSLEIGGDLGSVKAEYRRRAEEGRGAIVSDLDGLPFPEYSLRELKELNFPYPLRLARSVRWGHMLTSRGCPYPCIFCSQAIRESYGDSLRLRSPFSVADEMQGLVDKGANVIAFDDDNFTTSKEHVLSVCAEISRRGIKAGWIAHARVDNISPDMLGEMKKAGCLLLRFGIESGSERVIKILRKSQNADWPGRAKDVFTACKKAGIATAALFIVGSPSETMDDINKSMALSCDLDPDILQVSFFTPYPGSDFYSSSGHSESSGLASVNGYHYFFSGFNASRVDDETLKRVYAGFYKRFILRPLFLARHFWKYKLFYFFNPGVAMKLLSVFRYFRKNGR